jgi:hypothetical protein
MTLAAAVDELHVMSCPLGGAVVVVDVGRSASVSTSPSLRMMGGSPDHPRWRDVRRRTSPDSSCTSYERKGRFLMI